VSGQRWIRIATHDSIPPREGRVISLAGWEIAVFNLGGRFLALENRCPHQGGPLSDGIVTGCAVVCPLHAWKVRLDTGEVDRPANAGPCVRTFATRVDGDTILVRLPPDRADDGEGRAA
jgi:nitrite reductase (NADH) small subunit